LAEASAAAFAGGVDLEPGGAQTRSFGQSLETAIVALRVTSVELRETAGEVEMSSQFDGLTEWHVPPALTDERDRAGSATSPRRLVTTGVKHTIGKQTAQFSRRPSQLGTQVRSRLGFGGNIIASLRAKRTASYAE
jgi:hypothetical protein